MKERLIQARKRRYSPTGNGMLNVYEEQLVKGHKELKKTGETNVYEKIQLDLEQSKIENILHRLAMGDLNALNQRDATYMDATTMPKELRETLNIVLKAKNEFEKFPIEVKELFHNSPDEYVSQMGTKEYLDKMAPYNKKIKDIAEAGSMKEYEKKVQQQAKFENDVAKAKGVTVNE